MVPHDPRAARPIGRLSKKQFSVDSLRSERTQKQMVLRLLVFIHWSGTVYLNCCFPLQANKLTAKRKAHDDASKTDKKKKAKKQ